MARPHQGHALNDRPVFLLFTVEEEQRHHDEGHDVPEDA
eukprot:CAMPEP_0181274458 /NCGR_PEP_ID=MMETSP1097-20121128/9265_1 /TAXON_ID=35684 /ORGANISM="Pseudopedinella elastica, Strain CCMP716" /LENGTH=38 /DNA_ID= /DNA_START= /DNA_END= /DNA_ORIENTATION=